jgi:hypothetical protein
MNGYPLTGSGRADFSMLAASGYQLELAFVLAMRAVGAINRIP